MRWNQFIASTPLNLSNNYYFYLLAFSINQKPKNITTNIYVKSQWIQQLLILLCTSTLTGKWLLKNSHHQVIFCNFKNCNYNFFYALGSWGLLVALKPSSHISQTNKTTSSSCSTHSSWNAWHELILGLIIFWSMFSSKNIKLVLKFFSINLV